MWKRLPPDARPRHRETEYEYGFKKDRAGSIVWPWIGRAYKREGVAVAGLNLRTNWEETTVALEYWIADNDRKQFVQGHRRSTRGSAFAYRSMSAAAAVIASRNGERPTTDPPPESLVAVMDQIARLQLVKCNPNASAVPRGAPSKTMCERCPDRFLIPELQMLAPRALVLLGHDAFRAVNGREEVRWRSLRDHFARGTFSGATHEVELFWLPHPAGSQWKDGYGSLLRSLRARRAGSP